MSRYHDLSTHNDNNTSSKSDASEVISLHKENSENPVFDWRKPLFGNKHTSLQKLLENANRTTERATKFLNKIKSKQLAYANRAKSIPANATIRKEYIKCGKGMCELKHGPYYYAYWKDAESKKLKKKYIGNHLPKKEPGNDNNNTL